MCRLINKSSINGRYKPIQSRRGLTLIELIVAMAIATIVGAMTLMMFIFPQRIVNKGEKMSDIQFDLRMISQAITDSSRLASGIEILPSSASIPDPGELEADNNDIYFFIKSSDEAFVRRDHTGDRVIVQATDLEVIFQAPNSGKTLSYSISGTSADESFSLSSQVLPLNLAQNELITDNSGASDGSIIWIKNATDVPDTASLSFSLKPSLTGVVGSYFTASFEAANHLSENLVYELNSDLLPAGLTFANRTITGIPTTAGQFQFEVKLSDGTQTAIRSFVITIAADENSIPNDLPTVSGLELTGTFEVGFEAEGRYLTFTDPTVVDPPLTEGSSTVTWYTKSTPTSTDSIEVSGPFNVQANTFYTYSIKSADVGRYLYYEITPVNSDNVVGIPVTSGVYEIIANAAPSVTVQSISPAEKVAIGEIITANFTYNDADNDPMAHIRYTWYRSSKDDPNHSAYTETIASGPLTTGLSTINYTTTSADKNMFISLELVPFATTGELEGEPVRTVFISIKNN